MNNLSEQNTDSLPKQKNELSAEIPAVPSGIKNNFNVSSDDEQHSYTPSPQRLPIIAANGTILDPGSEYDDSGNLVESKKNDAGVQVAVCYRQQP